MTSEQLENLMTQMKLPWQRVMKGMWYVDDPEGKAPRLSICVEPSSRKDAKLVKFIAFISDVPQDATADFFKDFLRLNFRVDHGTFAMETRSEMAFIDTLEMEHLDPNEFEATFLAMRNAAVLFKEHYDTDVYTIGKPRY